MELHYKTLSSSRKSDRPPRQMGDAMPCWWVQQGGVCRPDKAAGFAWEHSFGRGKGRAGQEGAVPHRQGAAEGKPKGPDRHLMAPQANLYDLKNACL